jgi:hypothetical protein
MLPASTAGAAKGRGGCCRPLGLCRFTMHRSSMLRGLCHRRPLCWKRRPSQLQTPLADAISVGRRWLQVFAVADRSAASAGHRQYELRPPLLQTLDVGVSVLQGRVGWSWDHDRSFRRRRWCSDGGWQATNAGDGAAVRSVTGAATRASSVHRGGGELRRERKARMRSRGEIFASWR